MRVLVTGGAGFIGFHLSKKLLARGDSVVVVDNLVDYYDVSLKKARIEELKKAGNNTSNTSSPRQQLRPKNNFFFCKEDISDYKAMDKVFKKYKFDKICHLAAQPGVRYSLKNPLAYEKANVLGTLVILELARKHGVKDIVYASSSSVYGNSKKTPFSEKDNVDNPVSLYAATKKADELMAYTYHHLYGLNCTGLRFFTVYGPFGRPDMAYFKFVKSIIGGKAIEVYNSGKMRRDFTYVSDIVDGIVAAIDKAYAYEIFNLGGDNPVELSNFIRCIEDALRMKAKKVMLPMQPGDVFVTEADVSKARKMLGYKPKIKIQEGIRLFVEWYREYYHA